MSQEIKLRFTGELLHAIDPKNRVTVPAAWRDETYSSIVLIRSKKEGFSVVKCYTKEGLEKHLQNTSEIARALGHTAIAIKRKVERIASQCFTADLNSQGKVVLPKVVLQHLKYPDKIDKEDATLVGYSDHFCIWRPKDYQTYSDSLGDEDDELQELFDIS